MDRKDQDALRSFGYFQYAVAPCEKFSRTITASNGDHIELRIRTTSQEEQALHGKKYSAKARRRDGLFFGIGFEAFFGDDVEDLDRKMQEDVKKKCRRRRTRQ